MKIIKISAIWCGACLVTNKVWNRFKEQYDFDSIELDYDMDEEEVIKYNPGTILPVFLFLSDNQEVGRLRGEVTFEELEEMYKKVGE